MSLRDWRWPASLNFPSVIQRVKTDGVLTPLLWLCGLSFLSTLIAAYIASPVMWIFAAISCGSALWVFRSFDFFRSNNPNLMQSERLQIELAKQQQIIAGRVAEDMEVIDGTTSNTGRLTNNSRVSDGDGR